MDIPVLGAEVPKRGNLITRAIGRILLVVYRWRIKGELHNSSKFIVVLAPHTSYWEFFIGKAVMLAMGFRASFLVGDTYAWWPFGAFLRWLGGIPVNRRAHHNVVSQVVGAFNEAESLMLVLTPEGTRKKVSHWKSGFWHIAKQAGVPIQLASFDYDKRFTEFGPVIKQSDSYESDLEKIQNHYKSFKAKNPDKFGGEYL